MPRIRKMIKEYETTESKIIYYEKKKKKKKEFLEDFREISLVGSLKWLDNNSER